MKPVKTLISSGTAYPGYKFKVDKPSEKCKVCRFRKVCIENLSLGRIYTVRRAYDKEFDCPLQGKVKLVEVELAKLLIGLESSKIHISAITRYQPDCKNEACAMQKYCINVLGLREGDKIRILREISKLKCPLNRDIRLVEVELLL